MWFWITLKMWHTVTYPIRRKVSQYKIVFTEMISMFCKLLAFFLLLQSHCTRPSVQLQCIEIGGIETTILLPISLSLSGQEREKMEKLQELDNKTLPIWQFETVWFSSSYWETRLKDDYYVIAATISPLVADLRRSWVGDQTDSSLFIR